jgi:hypothetical protein
MTAPHDPLLTTSGYIRGTLRWFFGGHRGSTSAALCSESFFQLDLTEEIGRGVGLEATGAIVLLDERKAVRICGERLPAVRWGSTLDVMLHPDVRSVLGAVDLADAVFNALVGARMRVPEGHVSEVLDLIGRERAQLCTSLSLRARSGQ